MRKYYILLISLTIILILAAFCTLWFDNAVFQTIFLHGETVFCHELKKSPSI